MPFTSTGNDEGMLCTMYKAYVSGDMEIWKNGIVELEDLNRKNPSSYNLYSLADSRYGYIGYLMTAERNTEAKLYVNKFEGDIEKLANYPDRKAETEAFRVALLGFRMGLNPIKAVSLGPKALKQLDKAMDAGINNPAVWIEKANSEAHMPSFAGGSKARAAESFRHAISLFEAKKDDLECNWKYLNTLVLLGKVLEQSNDYKGACEVYRKALLKEASFQWVRDELLPEAEKKLR